MSTQILMPALSPTMEEGKLAKWHVKEGDAVKPGDILAEIETDKATMEFEAVDEGKIGKILVPEGAEGVKVNVPIAVLLGEGETSVAAPAAVGKPQAATPSRSPLEGEPNSRREFGGGTVVASPLPEPPSRKSASAGSTLPQGEGGKSNGRLFASPLARRVAEMRGVNLNAVVGSGPRGRIVLADIDAAQTKGTSAPIAAKAAPQARVGGEAPAAVSGMAPLPDARLFYKQGEFEEVPHDSLRKTIARRLTSAKSLIPHYYLTVDCDIGALMEARARLNARSPKAAEGAYKLSINDYIVKAAAAALMRHPDVNASWTDTAVLRHKHADIGIAVDLNPGLITPIVFKAETKGLVEISNEVKSLAERAKQKKLKPSEFEGGTFSISNLGMFGTKQFTAVINPPQSAIIAIGAGEERAIVRDGKIVAATIMTITMGCDHRTIDGATGARFLADMKSFVEEPASMLL